jgi:hypothetical protein
MWLLESLFSLLNFDQVVITQIITFLICLPHLGKNLRPCLAISSPPFFFFYFFKHQFQNIITFFFKFFISHQQFFFYYLSKNINYNTKLFCFFIQILSILYHINHILLPLKKKNSSPNMRKGGCQTGP